MLAILVLYVFAILFVELLSGSHVGESKFENVPQAMNYLLIQLLCGFRGLRVYSMCMCIYIQVHRDALNGIAY